MTTPTLILPHQGGGEFLRELDAPQLCCGVLHYQVSTLCLAIEKPLTNLSQHFRQKGLWLTRDGFAIGVDVKAIKDRIQIRFIKNAEKKNP